MGELIYLAVAFALEALCIVTGAWLVRLLSFERWREQSLGTRRAARGQHRTFAGSAEIVQERGN